jgi:uncharacterized protein (DUF2249 family)
MNEPEPVMTVDVREYLDSGREPFSVIMQAVSGLSGDQELRLIAPFEPVPLYQLMKERGYRYEATMRDDGNWSVVFSPIDALGG